MFHNREDAARMLARQFKGRALRDPLVLAIPRGGVVGGAVIAEVLLAELDVTLSRKLRSPTDPDLAIGAIAEDGRIYLNPQAAHVGEAPKAYLLEECRFALSEVLRRRNLFRRVRAKAPIEGRSVIVCDDGIATGSTMIAALQALRDQHPREVIVAVPVASAERLAEVRQWCDEIVCLINAEEFASVSRFFQDFAKVEDERVVTLLRQASARAKPADWAKREMFPEPAEAFGLR